tara:strand:+ start:774 stop:1940 length:1167 start_codon:yes stop_codon:yes gene_type:complete
MATFKVQIEDLTGAVSDDSALTQWLTDGAKEIINILPAKLKEKCASISILNATNGTTLDMDSGDNGRFGEIIQVTRLSADSGGYYIPCRKLHFMYGDLANDSSSIYYASATDPAYWVTSNSSGASTLFVKPTTTNAQPANVYRIAYPSVAHGDSVVANFPDEAEYLVVLYASIKGLQRLQNDLSSNSDITTALGAITTEINKVDNIIVEASSKIDDYYTSIGDIDDTTELWDNTNKRFKEVRDALIMAKETLDVGWGTDEDSGSGNDVTGIKSVGYWLDDEDTEMVSATISAANLELQRAQASIAEINAIMASYKLELDGIPLYLQEASSYIAQAQGYIGETKVRMERDGQKYQWYQSQQVKLQQDYDKGIQMLIGQHMPAQPAKGEQ